MPSYTKAKEFITQCGGTPSEGPHLTSNDHIQLRGLLAVHGRKMGDLIDDPYGDGAATPQAPLAAAIESDGVSDIGATVDTEVSQVNLPQPEDTSVQQKEADVSSGAPAATGVFTKFFGGKKGAVSEDKPEGGKA